MELTKEQIESLAGFAREILDNWPDDWGSWDGYQLQDLAEKHKILIPRTVTEPCGDNCNCAECYTYEEMKKGVTCYHVADWLARDAQQRNEADDAGHGAENTYSAKELYERVGNAIVNGYEILGETDIGDLLMECIRSGSSDE